MIFVLIGMSLLFFGIGFLINENNARYLLSGYNTMSEEKRKNFDLKAYIPYFRKFHLFLGISFLGIGIPLTYLVNENAGGIFLCVYPIVAYIYFMWQGSKFSKGINSPWTKTHAYILMGTLIFVVGLLRYGLREDELTVAGNTLTIAGIYGEDIPFSEIKSVTLVPDLPTIEMKTNGFALGNVNKGYFSTAEGDVKLILNSDQPPFILITKKSGQKVFYSAKDTDTAQLLEQIKSSLN